MPEIGELAPDFSLDNQDGKNVKLSDFRGRKVIIFAFPAAFTSGCTTQACGFRDEFPRFETKSAVVLGVSPDTPEKLKAWKDEKKLPYDLLSDPNHKMLTAWRAWGKHIIGPIKLPRVIRSFWVIDNNGRVVDGQVDISPLDSVQRALAAIEK